MTVKFVRFIFEYDYKTKGYDNAMLFCKTNFHAEPLFSSVDLDAFTKFKIHFFKINVQNIAHLNID